MNSDRLRILMVVLGLLALGVQSCQGRQPAAETRPKPEFNADVQVQNSTLSDMGMCSSQFVEHTLPVANGLRMREINTYESNGAGLAANDLDADGDIDLVFARIDRESAILWNEGGLKFREQSLEAQFARAVNAVDVDGDGLLDLVFTHRGLESLSYWRNQGEGRFARETLPGVDALAYSMAWADLDNDGDLDLVTGAYDIDLKQGALGSEEIRQRGGVKVYTQEDGQFTGQNLGGRSESLAIALIDLDGDGLRDVWAANDFAVPDGIWLQKHGQWEAGKPFRQTSYSSMSIDWGDLANDGGTALYTTDMNPGDISPEVLAAWLPVTSKLEEKHGPNDPQVMQNTMQIRYNNTWRNEAPRRGVDATGWSWSGKFGDLDNDGFLDLYVVNGMIANNLFAHLENSELVEANRAFRNRGDGTFTDAPQWGLGSQASGRGMVMADLDNDGDLDVVVNNLRESAQLFENQICGGSGLEVALSWSGVQNTHAIGAEVELHTSQGVLRRDVRAGSGYLSGDPSRLHFGIPKGAELKELVIHYPDGVVARVNELKPQTLVQVKR